MDSTRSSQSAPRSSAKKSMGSKFTGKISNGTLGIIAVAVLFVSAVVLNMSSGNTAPESDAALPTVAPDTQVMASTDYFTAFKSNRESVREREVAYLDAIISDPATDAETLAEAQAQKLEIVECMETEFTVESLIQAKGFDKVAVTFHKGSVNVIVGSDTLTDEQVAQILSIVMNETGEPATNVKVSASR